VPKQADFLDDQTPLVPLLGHATAAPEDYEAVQHLLTKERLLKAVHSDPTISEEVKKSLATFISENPIESELSGVAGFALANCLAKYYHLSKPSQFLAGLAGFGAGQAVLHALFGHMKGPLPYDSKNGVYTIPL
jgi:hypothetical protein